MCNIKKKAKNKKVKNRDKGEMKPMIQGKPIPIFKKDTNAK